MVQLVANRWFIALVLLILSGALRFYKLGEWSFASDEVYTLLETETIREPEGKSDHLRAIPRLIPLSFLVHDCNANWFGTNEHQSRLLIAILGTLSIPLIFVLLDEVGYRATAICTALLLTVWPDHLFQCQQTRYYATAWLLTSLALLVGQKATVRSSFGWLCAACTLTWAAILCHTVVAPLFLLFLVGLLLRVVMERERLPIAQCLLLFFCLATVLAYYFLSVRYLVDQAKQAEPWMYSPMHGLLSGLQQLGWPNVLLASFGILLMLLRRTASDVYWAIAGLAWLGQCAVLPRLVTFHPSYVFPTALMMFVPAGVAVAEAYTLLKPRSRVLATVVVVLAVLGTLPGVASHYSDGSRYDMRGAAEYVRQHRKASDRIAGLNKTVLDYYFEEPVVSALGSNGLVNLEALRTQPGRIWIIVPNGRSRIEPELAAWLSRSARLQRQVRKPRYDYQEFCVDVFLVDGTTVP